MTAYEKWIQEFVPKNPRGKCRETCEAMSAVFPELRKVRGKYYCSAGNVHNHWWLETAQGEVIDPTRDQFLSKGQGVYEEFTGEEPTGKCLNCGEYVHKYSSFCSERCNLSFLANLMAKIGKEAY